MHMLVTLLGGGRRGPFDTGSCLGFFAGFPKGGAA